MELTTFLNVIIELGLALCCILAALHLRALDLIATKWTGVLTGVLLISAALNIANGMMHFLRGNTTQTASHMARICGFAAFACIFLLIAFGTELLYRVLEERGGDEDKRARRLSFMLCAAGVLTLIVSATLGSLYTIDAQNGLHEAGGCFAAMLIASAAIGIMLIKTVQERRSFRRSEFILCLCFWLLPVAGALMQIAFRDIPLSNIACSIATLLVLNTFTRRANARITVRESTELNGSSIDMLSERIDGFLKAVGTEKQNRIRIRFTIEDALLRLWNKNGNGTVVSVNAGISLGRPAIRIEHRGEALNPFSRSVADGNDWGSGLLGQAGLSPTYSYSRGSNAIKIALPKLRINPLVSVMLAIAFGLMTGGVALAALSPADVAFVANDILMPIYDLWNNILFCLAAPAMLFIITSTILETQEVDEQGGSGRMITVKYFVISLAAGLMTFTIAALMRAKVFRLNVFSRNTVAEIIKAIFSIIPQNIIDPIRDFNAVQLITIGILFAYAVMAVGRSKGAAASLIHEMDMISGRLARWTAGVMPVFAVFLTAQLVLMRNAWQLTGLLRILPFAIGVSLIAMAAELLYVSKRMGVDVRILTKKLMPSFLLTIRSGQVAESYSFAEMCCCRELGIQKLLTQKVLPLGLVMFTPASIIGMLTFSIFGAFKSGVDITLLWILTAIILSLILQVAAPPIPGINLLSYIVIMDQLGIGREYVIYAMIFDIIFNMFAAAANQMMLQLDMILQADHMGLLEHDILRAAYTADADK